MRWLITNRNQVTVKDSSGKDELSFGSELDDLSYWTLDPAAKPNADITDRSNWTEQDDVTAFRDALVAAADKFPDPLTTLPENQKHLTLFIHGYDDDFDATIQRYDTIAGTLFDGPNSLGELVCFDWPSKGSLLGYLPDRSSARKTGDDLTDVLSELYDWMSDKQADAAENPSNACKAKTSIIAHSMGNYALEYAMNAL